MRESPIVHFKRNSPKQIVSTVVAISW